MHILLVDDQRELKSDQGIIARDYWSAIYLLEICPPFDVLELDNDLGNFDENGREWMGYDILNWFEQHMDKLPGKIIIITANIVMKPKMQAAVKRLYSEKNNETSNQDPKVA